MVYQLKDYLDQGCLTRGSRMSLVRPSNSGGASAPPLRVPGEFWRVRQYNKFLARRNLALMFS